MTPRRMPILIVASWYPGVDDPARGRFVADQADALAATGRMDPLVVSFDSAIVDGDQVSRVEELGTVTRHRRQGLADHPDVVNRSAWGLPPGVATTRLPILAGIGRATPGGSDGDLRREAILDFVERLDLRDLPTGIVHAHTAYPDGYAAAALAKRLGWPLVITEHASFVARQLRQPAERQRYLEAVATASRFLAVSDVLAGELAAAIPELSGKLEVMPNTIPLDDYTPVGLDRRRPEELLFVGYRKPTKGIATLIRAFADVHAARPGATLRLIGRSPTEEVENGWRQMARDLGVGDAVHFDAPRDRAGVARAMTEASLLVHPSPRETFGMTTLEALASGMPVVATRSGGISGILEDARLGLLVPPHDSRALARGVLRALDQRDSYDPHILRAAVEPYSATVVGQRLVDLYDGLVQTADTPRSTSDGRLGWEGTANPLPQRILVVAHETTRANAFLEAAPEDLLRRITLVTSGDGQAGALPDGIGAVVRTNDEIMRELGRIGLLGPRGTIASRVRRLARNPFAAIVRRLWLGRLNVLRWQAVVAGTRATMQRSDEMTRLIADGPIEVVCMDTVDHEAVEPWITDGSLRPAPGGLLWLADRWTSAQDASVTPSRSSTSAATRSPTTAQS